MPDPAKDRGPQDKKGLDLPPSKARDLDYLATLPDPQDTACPTCGSPDPTKCHAGGGITHQHDPANGYCCPNQAFHQQDTAGEGEG